MENKHTQQVDFSNPNADKITSAVLNTPITIIKGTAVEWSINDLPYQVNVTFSWKGERITVQLENGEDVLKLPKLFSDFLTNNGIPNKVTKEL